MVIQRLQSQEVFKSTFKELINENYSIGTDIERYQGVLEHALSKVDFSDIHASKQFKLKYWEDEGIQQQNISEQHRHEKLVQTEA